MEASNSVSQSPEPHSFAPCESPEAVSRPANTPAQGSSLEASPSNMPHPNSLNESESGSNDSTVWQDTNTELIVDEVPFPVIPTYRALGIFTIAILVGGTMIVIAALSFLIFLWHGEGSGLSGEHASSTWRNIMLHERLPQVITLHLLPCA